MRKYLFPFFICAFLFCAASAFATATLATKTDIKSEIKPEAAKPAAPITATERDEVKPIDLDLTLGDPEDSEMGLLGITFKNFIIHASKGKMNINLEYSGGLDADEAFSFHKVQTGKLDMAFGGVGNLAPMVRDIGVVTLPYLFPDMNAVIRGTTGEAARLLDSYAEKAGLRILAWTYYGYRYISNSKKPIKTLADMKGMRFRVPQSLAMIKTYRAFGAIPSPLAWQVTRDALKNDLVDGQCYDYNGFRAMKFKDVGQKYITEIHYLYNLQPLVINKKLFDSLSAGDQQILLDAGQYIQDLSAQYQKEMNEMAKKALMAEGVHITTLDDETEWREKAIKTVWPEAADNFGGIAAVNAYLNACGLPEWQPAKK